MLLLYALVTTTLYYLGSRALITKWLWSRYPGWLDKLTLCAACSGFWYGLAIGAWAYVRAVPLGPLPGDRIDTVIITGLASATWTALVGVQLVRALDALGGQPEAGADGAPQERDRGLLDDAAGCGAGDDREHAA